MSRMFRVAAPAVLCILLVSCSRPGAQTGKAETTTDITPIVRAQHVVTSDPPETFLVEAPMAVAAEGGETFVTVYNNDLASVKEVRTLDLQEGINEIRYSGVPDQIDPTSVGFTDRDHPETQVIEQNYRYDLVSQQELLKQYLGSEVGVTVQEGDSVRKAAGTLLSFTDGIVLQTQDGIEAFQNVAGFSLPSAKDLITKPTLIWLIDAAKSGRRTTETSYLTRGMTWRADYIAVVNEDDTRLGLEGWTTINNASGKDYLAAKLQLVAGSVNTVQRAPMAMMRKQDDMAVMEMAGSPSGFAEEGLFEYHLYTLGRETDLKNKEQKQVRLLSAKEVSAEKRLEYDAQKSDKIRTVMKLKNTEEAGLGMPLPAGVLRAFKADSAGRLQFIGEDSVDHTPENEEIDVFLGSAFDVTAQRNIMESKAIPNPLFGNRGESQTVEVTFVSGKDEDVVVTIVEHAWGKEAKVSGPNVRKIDAHTFEIDVTIPAGKETKVSYDLSWIY